MFRETNTSVSGFPSFGEAGLWRNGTTNERKIHNFVSPGQIQMKSPKDLPSSAFKVYDRVLEKHRYVPRKWTQEEFEAALPERFRGKTAVSVHNSEAVFQKEVNIDEFDAHSENAVCTPSENTHQPSNCQDPQKKTEIKEKIKNLKAIFEKTGNSNPNCETSNAVDIKLKSFGKGEAHGKETEELERCKDSEAKVKLIEEDLVENCNEDMVNDIYENTEILNNVLRTTEISHNTFSSFLDALLRCLLNIEPFDELLSLNVSKSNPIIGMLKHLMQSIGDPGQLVSQELFLEFWEKILEIQNCDEMLVTVLGVLIDEIGQATGENEGNLRSLIQGKFCHIESCDRCTSVAKDFEPFLFLNPTTPPTHSRNNSILNINFLSCSSEGVWYITTRQFVITHGMTVAHVVDELLGYPEFNACESSSIRIGKVSGGRIVKTLDNNVKLSTIRSTSDIFAFNVLRFNCEFAEETNALSGTAMSYHLYFNCGLCLSDGKEVGLFIHKNCGGMICRDCLDVITQSYQDWELCPCPNCEQPIDLDKELCRARTNREMSKELNPASIEGNRRCKVMFRADKHIDGGSELFGCPLMVSLPHKVTGYHLYRCIGYLLPNALPMKDRTSFTLHTVDKSGHGCSTCSLDLCSGCLIRIGDNIRITRDTNLVVHFDDLAEESKKNFGIPNPCGILASNSQGLFDGILQSCVRASTTEKIVCSKCCNPCKVSSSIAEFPRLLIIHLNHLYADQGLPPDTTVADVSRFLVLHGNVSTERATENLTYQLTAVVLADESSIAPSYKAVVSEITNDTWILYEESYMGDTNPYQLHLTKNSVLFYQPDKNSDPPKVGHVLQMPLLGQREHACKVNEDHHVGNSVYSRKLATISEEMGSAAVDFKRATKQALRPKAYDRQLEPGEYEVAAGAIKPDVYSSKLSLGEIVHDAGMHPRLSVDFDGISPISTQEICNSGSKLVRETKKLIRAVKQEDAYGIVCALKRGANPCLLINDVSTLHLAAGLKSDQRCSIVSYLLKYANDVNIATADGTTPLHVAAAWGHQDALELLLTHGGDAFELTDQEGNSAFDLASKNCSSFLQLLYQSNRNSPGSFEPSTSSRTSSTNQKPKRLEDIVRSNVTLPSFVHEEDRNRSRLRRRWLKRFRSFRNKSSGVFRSLRRISSIRRRSRIGVMVQENEHEQNIAEKM